MLVPIFREALDASRPRPNRTSASGAPARRTTWPGGAFSFVAAVDAIGAWPPIRESHVEMDAAWALYEAWVKIQTGEVDTALVYGFGKSSRRAAAPGAHPAARPVLRRAAVAGLGRHRRAAGAAGLERRAWTERDMAEVAARSRATRRRTRRAGRRRRRRRRRCSTPPYVADPLRAHDCAPITDGAAAVVLAAGDRARELCERPAWITASSTASSRRASACATSPTSPSTAAAAQAAGGATASTSPSCTRRSRHEEHPAAQALGLGDDGPVNPSGGPLAGNPMIAAGLIRIGEAARRDHRRRRATGRSRTRPAARACSRTSSACWRAD